MNEQPIIISGVHFELSDRIKRIVTEKAEKLFNHDNRLIRLRVELEYNENKRSGKAQEYVATGHLESHGPVMVAKVASDNMYKSVDQMVDKLNRMLRRRHRLQRVKRKSPHGVDIPAELPKVKTA
ncbi:MAG: ribosome hibernation-promoting factor, HPF/YfiA family [Opitutales bacterium]